MNPKLVCMRIKVTKKMNYEKLQFEREIIDVVRSSYI